jgi:ferredoxin
METRAAACKYLISGCIGCRICIENNPKIFKLNNEGEAEIDLERADKNSICETAKLCPVGAIKIIN